MAPAGCPDGGEDAHPPGADAVPPQQRSRSHGQGMKQRTHRARCGWCGIAPAMGTDGRHACGQKRPRADMASAFSTMLRRNQRVACGTSLPVKRCAFPHVAVAGGVYPEGGTENAGEAGCRDS